MSPSASGTEAAKSPSGESEQALVWNALHQLQCETVAKGSNTSKTTYAVLNVDLNVNEKIDFHANRCKDKTNLEPFGHREEVWSSERMIIRWG